jgi:predicted nucleic acid-binding protein
LKTFLLDASVAIRFLLKEDLSLEAELMLESFIKGEIELVAPDLLISEVGNSLRTAVERNIIKKEEAEEAYSVFLKLGLGRIILSRSDLSSILLLSIKKRISFYDCIYIYASGFVGASLISADEQMINAAKGETSVINLKDFSI